VVPYKLLSTVPNGKNGLDSRYGGDL